MEVQPCRAAYGCAGGRAASEPGEVDPGDRSHSGAHRGVTSRSAPTNPTTNRNWIATYSRVAEQLATCGAGEHKQFSWRAIYGRAQPPLWAYTYVVDLQ